MNRFFCAGISVITLVFLFGCEKGKAADGAAADADLVTSADTVSYIIGTDIARSLKHVKDDVVLDVVISGIKAGLAGEKPRFKADQERVIMQAFNMKMQQQQMAKTEGAATKNMAEAKAFLEENGKKEGVVTTPSGLQYKVLVEGKGPVPSDNSKVKVHYEGKLLSGKVFDSSLKRGKPMVLGVNQVIKGWSEALKMMKVGSKYQLWIPPELAYGRRGMAHDIKPNMCLTFEVELIGIEADTAAAAKTAHPTTKK